MEVYIKTHQIGPDDYLFTNKNGGPYRSMTFRHQMKKFCEDHEIDGGDYLFQSHAGRIQMLLPVQGRPGVAEHHLP